MSETTEEQQEEQKPQDFPGKRLKEAREAAGMTRSDVASQMRLNERMVGALEEDNYEVFPSATFVSGYLRSYARILGLPEDEFVRPVNDSIEPPSIVSTIGSRAQVSSRDLPVRLVTYLLVIVVIVSISMWWFSQRNGSPAELMSDVAEVVESGSDIDLALPAVEESKPLPELDDTDVADADTKPQETTGEVEAENADEEAAVDSAPQPETVQGETVGEVAPVMSATKTEASNEEAPAPPPLTEATPISKLELHYQADSWTEVSDSAGRSLVYGLIKAGQVLELKGVAPFRVFLGYAPGVTVYYNNDLFDHSPFQRRDVARFRIGRAEHNLPGPR